MSADRRIAPTPRSRRRSVDRAAGLLAYLPILVAAGLLALVPLRYHESGSMMRVITEGMLFAAYAVAFNIIFGSTGQLFLCVGALAGVGGFMSAIFADRVGLPMVVAIAAASRCAGHRRRPAQLDLRQAGARHDLHRHRHARLLAVVRQPAARPQRPVRR